MNAKLRGPCVTRRRVRTGFTLVEILTVIVIIGILAAIAIPAVTTFISRGKDTAIRMEVNSIAQAVQQYQEKYGDFPPDGSNQQVLLRHVRKVFPRISTQDLTLLNLLTDGSQSSDTVGTFSGVAMDRAEALVFFLGGFSSDIQFPFSGAGGPLEFIGGAADSRVDLQFYQYNIARDNYLFEFDPNRLEVVRDGTRYVSNDESNLGFDSPAFTSRGGNDLLPTYRGKGVGSSLIYFDSRTYGVIGEDGGENVYNGYRSSDQFGAIRPYKTEFGVQSPQGGGDYDTEDAAFGAVKFANPDSFQIISPGQDGVYGSAVAAIDGNDGNGQEVLHFVIETGAPVYPNVNASDPAGLIRTVQGLGTSGFQDREFGSQIPVNGHLDNVTNFIDSIIANELP